MVITLLPWQVSKVLVHLSDFRWASRHQKTDQQLLDQEAFPGIWSGWEKGESSPLTLHSQAHSTNSPNHSRTNVWVMQWELSMFFILYEMSLVRDWKRKVWLITLGSERVNVSHTCVLHLPVHSYSLHHNIDTLYLQIQLHLWCNEIYNTYVYLEHGAWTIQIPNLPTTDINSCAWVL